jgi:hypothetical protein
VSRAARLLPVLAAAAALAAPVLAHADPALPAGWVAGAPAAPMPPAAPPGAKSRVAMQLAASPPRAAVTPVPVALADLDTVEIAPSPTGMEVTASNAEPPGDPPEDLFIDHGCTRASVSGHAVGHIEVGWLSGAIAPQSGGGVMLYGVRGEHGGGDGKHRYVRASWETLDLLPGGALRFTETVARFNVVTCKAHVANRYTATARPIFGGRAFLFRTRCPACAPDLRDQLHVIAPGESFRVDDFQHKVVALAPGLGDGVVTRSDPFLTAQFARAVGRPAPAPAPREGVNALVGIEAVQGLGEASPTVIAYTSGVRERF